jgi:hypothetical protein
MDDNELREMDVKVHKALYPALEPELLDGYWYCRKPGAFSMTRVPCYTTDLADWEPVYALKPGWAWSCVEYDQGVLVTLREPSAGAEIDAVVSRAYATGLAAYALGRARCVLQWAEAQPAPAVPGKPAWEEAVKRIAALPKAKKLKKWLRQLDTMSATLEPPSRVWGSGKWQVTFEIGDRILHYEGDTPQEAVAKAYVGWQRFTA